MKKYVAEAFGTFVLVLVGCGSAVIAGDQIGYLGISLAFWLAVLTMAYAIGPISGCHINPAVSFGMWLRKKMTTKEMIGYMACQFSAAILAAVVLMIIVWWNENLGANGFWAEYLGGFSMMQAFIAEVVFTAIFLLVIFGSTAKKAAWDFAWVSIGLALAMIHMVTIPITGTSVNPARSFGPALMQGGEALSQLWLFFAAPFAWAFLAWIIWHMVFQKN